MWALKGNLLFRNGKFLRCATDLEDTLFQELDRVRHEKDETYQKLVKTKGQVTR